MNYFLIDKDQNYSYQKLLKDIRQSTYYYPVLITDNLYLYFKNLILSLVADQPLTLLDSDLQPSMTKNIDVRMINKTENLEKNLHSISSIENLVEKVLSSKSTVTIFTSGTTGQPKEVNHTIKTLTRYLKKNNSHSKDIWAFAYNPSHIAGLQVFFQAFANQNPIINVFNMGRNEIYSLIDKYQITHISATPTFYRLLLPKEISYPSIQRATFGGEKTEGSLFEKIQQIFPNAKMNNIYASTEAGSLFASKGDCFQIPEEIKDYIKFEENELLIHKCLLGNSKSFFLKNNYYYTGDLIEWIDKDAGLFKFKSRKNELINVGGYKVNPNEVENVILQIDGVQQTVVYGKLNSVLGNILCADIKMEKGKEITEIEIRKILSYSLQDFKIPRIIKFTDNIVLTRTGKIKRS